MVFEIKKIYIIIEGNNTIVGRYRGFNRTLNMEEFAIRNGVVLFSFSLIRTCKIILWQKPQTN